MAEKQHERTLEQIDRKGEWDLRKAEVTAYAIDDEGGATENISNAAEIGLKQQELGLKQQEINLKERESQRKVEIEKDKMKSNEKIAKIKPKPTTKK